MRFAHDAHVIPVMGSSTCSECVVSWRVLVTAWYYCLRLGDVVAGLVDGGAHGVVVEQGAGDSDALGVEVDVDGRDARDLLDLGGDGDAAVGATHPWNGVGQLLGGMAHGKSPFVVA